MKYLVPVLFLSVLICSVMAYRPAEYVAPNEIRAVYTNNFGMEFIWIPPGEFFMGSPSNENEREPEGCDETLHRVTLSRGFYMGKNLVTQEQWRAVMGDNPSEFKGETHLPVEFVNWEDCQRFISKLRLCDGTPYRLPTEAEWEYSCRAGTVTRYHFGDSITPHQANFADFENRANSTWRTSPVGAFAPNSWGLNDMHGNLWQWCHDWFGDYPRTAVIDPKGPQLGIQRIQRGGSWDRDATCSRSAMRRPVPPGLSSASGGCRVCFSSAN
jgi:formylglycine-generating enzyme required for sulfatase activity